MSKSRVNDRVLDTEAIKKHYDELVAKREAEKRAEKEKIRQEKEDEKQRKMEEMGEEYEEEEEPEIEEEEDEEDPDAPNYDNMLAEAKEKLSERYDADVTALEELNEQLQAKNIKTKIINSDSLIQNVFKQIRFELKLFFEQRENMFERFQIQKLKPNQVSFYEQVMSSLFLFLILFF